MKNNQRLIVVGGNAAGMAAALRARRNRPDIDITVVEKSDRISIANCSIPAYLEGLIESIDSLQVISPEEAFAQHRVDVLTGHQALEIHPTKHLLAVENLSTGQSFELPYHRLILSTGADPIRPDWPNVGAKGIFTLRNLDDAQSLRNFIERKKPAKFIVIGTGTIAQSCAAALRRHGLDVLMIGNSSGLMEDLEEPIAKRIHDTLVENDISEYYTDNLSGFKVSLEYEVTSVLEGSKSFPCQGVLLAMGVKPNVNLVKKTDISIGHSGAIRVDRHLMTSRQRIYACGDCAETVNRLTNRPIYWPLATTAARQGRQAGESACGGRGYDPGTFAVRLWTCFDLHIGRIGLSGIEAEENGFRANTTYVRAASKPSAFGGDELDLVLITDRKDDRLIGAQVAGREGVHARFNTLAAAIAGRLTLRDLENLDLGYTPRISNLWDPVQIGGRLGSKRK